MQTPRKIEYDRDYSAERYAEFRMDLIDTIYVTTNHPPQETLKNLRTIKTHLDDLV